MNIGKCPDAFDTLQRSKEWAALMQADQSWRLQLWKAQAGSQIPIFYLLGGQPTPIAITPRIQEKPS
jgi:hypothetical protein